MSEVSLVSEEAVDLAALALRSPSHKPGPPDPDLVAIWKRTARITLEAAAPLMQQQMDLLAWLLAEARWERDQALREIARTNNAWRGIVEQWERGHQDDVLPYTAQLEGEIAALKAEVAERTAAYASLHEVVRAFLAGERNARYLRRLHAEIEADLTGGDRRG